ncbi:Hypothetical predicted protein [Paramuricea clavata]|uniref:Uncharacterized protein n=1 Tax=Paramuricea clavata TaxID=317549 RepID=A0A7D9KG57_PARCT|nr:Hypothetical predicted protein [Paramuricea clavata]
MSLRVCSCCRGKDGAPCKHQYLIWAANIATCVNFVPISDPDEWQKLAAIALGGSLSLTYYTSLRGQRNETHDDVDGGDSQQPADHADEIPMTTSQLNLTTHSPDASDGGDKAKLMVRNSSVQNACSVLTEMLQSSQDAKLCEAALRFSERLTQVTSSSLPNGKLASALFDFGQSELCRGKVQSFVFKEVWISCDAVKNKTYIKINDNQSAGLLMYS